MSQCEYRPVERTGLYVMVIFILLHSCSIEGKVNTIIEKIDKIVAIGEKENGK